MTCEPHQEAEELDRRLEEEQRRERESWGIPAPAETSPARVDEPVPAGVTVDPPPAVLDSPYPPAPPTVDELGRITVPLNLKR